MKTLISTLIVSSLALATLSCHKKDDRSAEAAPSSVEVANVVVDSVTLSKSYPGTIGAKSAVDVVARVNGYLVAQEYENGDDVKKGQVLFRIEDTQYRDAVQQAKATLDNAKSELEYAEKNYAAMRKALESDAVAQIQVLESKNSYEQAQAAVENAKAALETAQTNLGYCTVVAPFDGTMTKGEYSTGAYIGGAGSPVKLGSIYDNKHFWANFSIEDASFLRAQINQNNRHLIDYDNVPVNFSEELPHSYSGPLSYISPNVDSGTGTLSLRVGIDSPWGELRNGMYCTVNLPYQYLPEAIMVKDASIATSQTTKYVYLVNDSNQVVYTPIEVGEMANDSMRIVTSGLKGGERYVTKALLKVRPGMEIKPVMEK
ncbi:MAG: efflux RND transporter periplasmic adaptor subunit [Clostridium sp.]|nr:efflux RND transporter periplasmic adaptor subunit [Clostridium sp.]